MKTTYSGENIKTRIGMTLALAVAGTLIAGCSEREPTRSAYDIPAGGVALDAWADKVAEDNNVEADSFSASDAARTICKLISEKDDLMDVGMEIAGFRGVDSYEATRLMAIAVYGYCPEYKSRWESHDHFKDVDVAGVTHVSR